MSTISINEKTIVKCKWNYPVGRILFTYTQEKKQLWWLCLVCDSGAWVNMFKIKDGFKRTQIKEIVSCSLHLYCILNKDK